MKNEPAAGGRGAAAAGMDPESKDPTIPQKHHQLQYGDRVCGKAAFACFYDKRNCN
jgi:hypothetical protein